jgi:hypothetical protein
MNTVLTKMQKRINRSEYVTTSILSSSSSTFNSEKLEKLGKMNLNAGCE